MLRSHNRSNLGVALLAAVGLMAAPIDGLEFPKPPSTLDHVTWSTVGCPAGYDGCADMEICQVGDASFGYRLPGAPCTPARCPVIRMETGKKYQLQLHNNAREKSNLHTHGPHIPGDGNGDDITREIYPGQSIKYTWNIPAHHRGGTFWYHSHAHERTRVQVMGGAFGALIIEEHPIFDTLPEHFQRWMRNELLLIASRVDKLYLGNGKDVEDFFITKNEWYRLRICGVNPVPVQNELVEIDPKSGCIAYPALHDGAWTWKIPQYTVSSLQYVMTGANRVDLAIKCPHGGSFDIFAFNGLVARLNVQDGPTSIAWPFKNAKDTVPLVQFDTTEGAPDAYLRASYMPDLTKFTVEPRNTFAMKMTNVGIKDLSDGEVKLWNHDVPLLVRQYGEIQEWQLEGINGHPFHLHVYHMQVVSDNCGDGFIKGEYYDVVAGSSSCTVRFNTTDHDGRVVFHCHFLEHEDAGTMGWMRVDNGPGQDWFEHEPYVQTECNGTSLCLEDQKCHPQFQCGSDQGLTRCGRPCKLPSTKVPRCHKGTCSNNKCVWFDNDPKASPLPPAPVPSPVPAASPPPPELGPMYPDTSLVTLPWKVCGSEFCGKMEFCSTATGGFSYRLPGAPCQPAKGPVIRMMPGKTYRLTLRNTANMMTNLHTHGPHVTGDGNGDDITRDLEPGMCMTYTWKILPDHLGGTFWYHSHVHEHTREQVSGGAFGMLIIEENPSKMAAFGTNFFRWMYNELLLVGSRVDDDYRGNGNTYELLNMHVNVWYRMRIAGVNPVPVQNPLIEFPEECEVYPTAHDGVWTFRVPETNVSNNRHFLTGANRLDVAIRCSVVGKNPVSLFGGVVAFLNIVQGNPGMLAYASPWNAAKGVKGLFDTTSIRPLFLQNLRTFTKNPDGTSINKLTLGLTNAGLKVNGASTLYLFDKMKPIPGNYYYNTIQEWTIEGSNGHPFHLHVYHMQVVTKGGCGAYREGEFYDVLSGVSSCTVRFRTVDWGGRVVFHCHFLEHEDAGTMGWVNIVDRKTGKPVAVNTTYTEHFVCGADCGDMCMPDYECGSTMGHDACGNACNLPAAPTCLYSSAALFDCTMNQCVFRVAAGEASETTTAVATTSAALYGLIGLAGLVVLAVPAFIVWRNRYAISVAHHELHEIEFTGAKVPELTGPANTQITTPLGEVRSMGVRVTAPTPQVDV